MIKLINLFNYLCNVIYMILPSSFVEWNSGEKPYSIF